MRLESHSEPRQQACAEQSVNDISFHQPNGVARWSITITSDNPQNTNQDQAIIFGDWPIANHEVTDKLHSMCGELATEISVAH